MNKITINNAISAYFGLAALLLLPSKKENINHPFVKKHSRSALFIHILMLLNYLFFITYSFGGSIVIYGFGLNHIFASIIFLGLFGLLLFGLSKASSGNDFSISDIATISKTNKIIKVKNSNLNEQGILTIILSLVPFLGFTIRGKFKNYKSPILENNLKLNLIVTFVISLFFVFSKENLGLLLILIYTIFIVFYSILIINKQNLIILNLDKIKTIEEIFIYTKSLLKYLSNYFSSKKFTSINEIIETEKNILIETDKIDKEKLMQLKDNKLPKYLAYIIYFNVICLTQINSKNKFHIINGLLLTILSIILFLLGYNNYQILILFPIFFGIGYIKTIEYKLPFLFDIYKLFNFILSKIFNIFKTVREKQKEVKEVVFKVGE